MGGRGGRLLPHRVPARGPPVKRRRSSPSTRRVLSEIGRGGRKAALVVAACLAMAAISTSQAELVQDVPHWFVTATFKHTGSHWRICYQTEDLPYCEKLTTMEKRVARVKSISEEDRKRVLIWFGALRGLLEGYRSDTGNTRTSGAGLRTWAIDKGRW